jgi:hypothetical protein
MELCVAKRTFKQRAWKMKNNCWEARHCNAQLTCPVCNEKRLDGIHGGSNAGRCCWVVSGTFCGGTSSGHFAKKYDTCEKCDFYQQVKQEEYPNFMFINLLRKKLLD